MCIDDIDALQPRNPNDAFDPEVGRLKRIIALKDQELACYRELAPGLKFSAKHNLLWSEPLDED